MKAWYRKFKNLVTVDANVSLGMCGIPPGVHALYLPPSDALYAQVFHHAQDIVNKVSKDMCACVGLGCVHVGLGVCMWVCGCVHVYYMRR